jgi:pyruvate,orthophosphate dikinase
VRWVVVKIGERMVRFGSGIADDVPAAEYGNKAAGLATMSQLGVPVPPGFSLTVALCEEYYRNGERLPDDFSELLRNGIAFLEKATGSSFGGSRRPLLVSVRSGAPVSMPGVMDTLLNVGLNRETLRGLISLSGNPRFAWDSYRRLLQEFARVIFRQDLQPYRAAFRDALAAEGLKDEMEFSSGNLRDLVLTFERIFSAGTGRRFPSDIHEQLSLAAEGVIRSWTNPRAEAFRRMNLIRDVRGTAVTVQAMVFGNMGSRSGAGVAFTRNPWEGTGGLLVDFKFGAQGEDVVSGDQSATSPAEFRNAMPEVFQELDDIGKKLESFYRDMQDLEFTVQEGKLYILQTRPGKRSPFAALTIAVNLCKEGIITPADVIWMLRDIDIDAIAIQKVASRDYPVAVGIPASGGVASGSIALSGERAEREVAEGHDVILVRETASPDDLPGIAAARGLLTMRGARTSHAAVVARQMGKICVVNCIGLEIDRTRKRCSLSGQELGEGEVISIDGNSGNVYIGSVEFIEEKPVGLISLVRAWEQQMQV